jgi:hypothetical protein
VVWGLDKGFSGILKVVTDNGWFVVEKVRAVWVVFRVSGSFAALRMTAGTSNIKDNSNSKDNGNSNGKCRGPSLRSG